MQVARPVLSVPTAAVAAPGISAAVVVCSVVLGITTSLILFCSHFHQITDDTAAKKMSPLVKLGTANGVKVSYCVAQACFSAHDVMTAAQLTLAVAWCTRICFHAADMVV